MLLIDIYEFIDPEGWIPNEIDDKSSSDKSILYSTLSMEAKAKYIEVLLIESIIMNINHHQFNFLYKNNLKYYQKH